MDEFPGLLTRDFGFRPQGKSAPMSASKGGPGSGGNASVGIGGTAAARSSTKPKSAWSSASLLDGHEGLFSNQGSATDYGGFADVFGGPPKSSASSSTASAFDDDSFFQKEAMKTSSLPVYDKPVYDDDIFEGVPGIKTSSSSVKYEDVFASMSAGPANSSSPYDDLLGNFAAGQTEQKSSSGKREPPQPEGLGLDDLIPGFGGSRSREASETKQVHQSTAPSTKSTSVVPDDPFVVLESTSPPAYSSSGLFTDPLENIIKTSNSSSRKTNNSFDGGEIFNDINAFNGHTNNREEKSPLRGGTNANPSSSTKESTEKSSSRNNYRDSNQTLFDMPTGSSDSHKSVNRSRSRAFSDENPSFSATNSHMGMSPKSEENLETTDNVWLSVSEIPLFTLPTNAPPPARPPPKPPVGDISLNSRKKFHDSIRSPPLSSVDELDDFASAKSPQSHTDERSDVLSSEEDIETNSAAAASAAAMKEAMDRAEAKFKHAKEVREREKEAKAARSRDSTWPDMDEKASQDALERENREKQEALDREREEKEKERRRLDREREREREERDRGRHAVEMATREARERAATEARHRAERVAVEKANAEARARAERAAVQRVAAEARDRAASDARDRAAAEARERAERVAAEARERADREAKEKEARDRAAVERAVAEVRLRAERAAVGKAQAEARERAAAAAAAAAAATASREKQNKTEDDLESFFGMGARPNSVPRQRTTSTDPFDTKFQSKGSEGVRRTSVGTSPNLRKASSTTNIVDDLSSIFGGSSSSVEFQEVEGESEDRRRARLERHQRTLERAAKALAEKNERDNQTQRDQEERHRISETLDIEIKRWAAGKEGNLRALLSTMQYVLWPECGWQPVSLTDLITGASVKKVYRKATLCIHPDKVQQKGANLQQKYIAEKVFDLLKEAWNKFNSEELF